MPYRNSGGWLDYSQLFFGRPRCKLDGRHETAALTVPVKRVLKGFPMDQVHMSDRGSITMRGGMSDSVHCAASGAIDIRRSMLLAGGADAELLPGWYRIVANAHEGIPLMNSA
jgi:hypothetical protein